MITFIGRHSWKSSPHKRKSHEKTKISSFPSCCRIALIFTTFLLVTSNDVSCVALWMTSIPFTHRSFIRTKAKRTHSSIDKKVRSIYIVLYDSLWVRPFDLFQILAALSTIHILHRRLKIFNRFRKLCSFAFVKFYAYSLCVCLLVYFGVGNFAPHSFELICTHLAKMVMMMGEITT